MSIEQNESLKYVSLSTDFQALTPNDQKEVLAMTFQDPKLQGVLEKSADAYMQKIRSTLQGDVKDRIEKQYYKADTKERLSALEVASVAYVYLQARGKQKPPADRMVGNLRAVEVWYQLQGWEILDEDFLMEFSAPNEQQKADFQQRFTTDILAVGRNTNAVTYEDVDRILQTEGVLSKAIKDRRAMMDKMKQPNQ
jgi:hypothetical protein